MTNNQQVTITLTVDSWKVIMEFIRIGCQPKGEDWIKWGQGINQTIQSSIEKTVGQNPTQSTKRTTVASRNINSIGYDASTRTLEIQFSNGSIYRYYQVPQPIYAQLMQVTSKDDYFQASVRNSFQYEKIGYEPINRTKKIIPYRFGGDDYDPEYGEESYTTRDLKNDIGMGFMSDDEFGNWLEDSGNDRD